MNLLAVAPIFFLLLVSFSNIGVNNFAPSSQTKLDPSIQVGPGMSANWSGYVIASGRSPAPVVTAVYGSWVVEQIQPSTSPVASAQWTGIGGFFNGDTTIIQAGTESSSALGGVTYSAWWETYPSGMHTVADSVTPGDIIQASVVCVLSCTGQTQTWRISISDTSQGWTFTKTVLYSSSLRSGEWVDERPTQCVLSKCVIEPLADFGAGEYGQDYTVVSGTDYATVAGVTLPVGGLPNTQVMMLPSASSAVMAQASTLSNDGTSFTVTEPGITPSLSGVPTGAIGHFQAPT